MSNLAQFQANLAAWQSQVGKSATEVIRESSLAVFDEVQAGVTYSPGTPIDTGRARSHWDAGLNSSPANPRADSPGAARIRVVEVLDGATAGDRVYLSNNAPHILALEFGGSAQAPKGMVRVTVEAASWIIRGVVLRFHAARGRTRGPAR